jgi:hypothetical protein
MADPEKKVDSRKLKVEERQNTRKKRHNTENTETAAQRARRKRKRPDGGRGANSYRK